MHDAHEFLQTLALVLCVAAVTRSSFSGCGSRSCWAICWPAWSSGRMFPFRSRPTATRCRRWRSWASFC